MENLYFIVMPHNDNPVAQDTLYEIDSLQWKKDSDI